MMRYATSLFLFLVAAPVAGAHFVFVYVERGEARVVFGHAAAPDPSAFPTRAEKTALKARDAAGKESKLALEKGDGNFYRAKLPAGTWAVVYGTTEAGVTQRGDDPPMLSWYHPKAIQGDPFAKGTEVAGALLDLVPVRDGDKVRFKVLSGGKPVSGVEVTVGLPGQGEEKAPVVRTDADGLTTSFGDAGRYCVAVRRLEEKAGELGGKKYAAVRHIATVVFDFAPKK